MLPSVLKNFNVFHDGVSWMGLVEKTKLPELKRKTESYRGGGMNGPVDIDLGQEALSAELTCGGLMKEALLQYGAIGVAGTMMRFAGAYQADDTEAVQKVEVIMRGRFTEIGMGDAQAGNKSEFNIKASLSYYKLSIDGAEIIEIDLVNFVEKINGTDVLDKQRKAIGLA